jgi:hypothetical protein
MLATRKACFFLILGVTAGAPHARGGGEHALTYTNAERYHYSGETALQENCDAYTSVDNWEDEKAVSWCALNCMAGFCPATRCTCVTVGDEMTGSKEPKASPALEASPTPEKDHLEEGSRRTATRAAKEQSATIDVAEARKELRGKCSAWCNHGTKAAMVKWRTRCLWTPCEACPVCTHRPEVADEGNHTAMEVCRRRWSAALHRDLPPVEEDANPHLRGEKCLQKPGPNMLFVHVGKTCGQTVTITLKNNAEVVRKLHPRHEPYDLVHVHPVRPEVLAGVNNVVVSLRDPVERLISAYNHAACVFSGADRSLCERTPTTKQLHPNFAAKMPGARLAEPNELGQFVLKCYPNVTAFADGLDDDSICGRVARDIIGLDRSNGDVNHIGKGTCYYLGGVAERLKYKRLHIVETDTCNKDIARIPSWLGLKETFSPAVMIHGGDFPHHRDTVSSEGRARLKKYLAHEYALQDQLRQYAAAPQRPPR